jgi:hypothetical protein
MDLGNIVYIVAVIGYFVYRAVSGKKEKELEGGDFSETTNVPKPVSFEDLLREIRDAQKPKSDDPKPVIITQEEIPREEKMRHKPLIVKRLQAPVEKVEMDEEAQFYQGAYVTAFQSTTKLSETNYEDSFLKVDLYQSSKKINRYAQILKSSKTLRESLSRIHSYFKCV